MKFPCEDDGQNIENNVVYDHDDRVGVEEGLDVDTSSRGILVPEMCDWNALEDDDQDAADTKGKSNELHKPDCPVMPTLICCVAVEEEKSELDEHVASQVKDEDGNVELMSLISTDLTEGRGVNGKLTPTL